MKTLSTAFFLLALLSTTGLAQAASSQADTTKRFSTAICSPNMPCPQEHLQSEIDAIVTNATRCVFSNFNYRGAEDDIFDRSFGLDYNLCLTTTTRSNSGEAYLKPRCCVIPMEGSEDHCQIKCTLDLTR